MSSEAADPSTGPDAPFLGWRVLRATVGSQFISSCVTFAPFGVFVVPIVSEFDTTRGEVSEAFGVAFLLMGLLGVIVGVLLDRGHARRIMLAGLVACSGGLIAMSQAESLAALGVLYVGLVVGGSAFYGMPPSMWLATQWFHQRRGLALGITVAGATIGAGIAPPLAAALIEAFSWREAVLAFGVGALVLGVPIFSRYAIARPADVGQFPDGIPIPPGTPAVAEVEVGALVRDPRLWLLAVGFAFVFSSPIVMMVALVPFAEDLGIDGRSAAFFFTASAPMSLLSKLGFGYLIDRIPARLAIWIVVLLNAATWGALLFDPGFAMLMVVGALYGIGVGAVGPLQAVVLARCFGPQAFGRASGIGGLASLPIISASPAIAGYLYDTTGTYHPVFELEVGLMIAGGLLLTIPRIPRS